MVAFFAWSAALARSLLWTVSRRSILSSWTDVACAKEMGNLWTNFFFIVMWLSLCGIRFLLVLVCLGLFLEELSTYLPIGGSLEGRGVQRFGRLCQFAFFGLFEMKEILGVSRIWKVPWRIF
jgi:hypothetical protein